MSAESLLLCYNRGCGQKFHPKDNKSDSCVHHPGMPVFHDAYKGWSCCNKKCTDFTEFLNIKGCTKGMHSNEKPKEPEKEVDQSKADEIIEYRAPISDIVAMERPPFDTAQVTIVPTISPVLLEQIKNLKKDERVTCDRTIINVGESCKNKACNATYSGPESDKETCSYHPGAAIFHEGLKFWSCCQKKTTDFSVFLAMPGCTQGSHLWISKNQDKKIECRLDWHQTVSFVVVSIFAKKYLPNKSSIKVNPIRLITSLFFPEENSSYDVDLELRGIIDVANTTVQMLPTKVEIKMKKAEPGSWVKLDFPREITDSKKIEGDTEQTLISDRVDAVDLNDL